MKDVSATPQRVERPGLRESLWLRDFVAILRETDVPFRRAGFIELIRVVDYVQTDEGRARALWSDR